MWFIGMLAGMALGAATLGAGGVVVLGLVGAFAGAAASTRQRAREDEAARAHRARAERIRAAENAAVPDRRSADERLATLEASIANLSARIAALESREEIAGAETSPAVPSATGPTRNATGAAAGVPSGILPAATAPATLDARDELALAAAALAAARASTRRAPDPTNTLQPALDAPDSLAGIAPGAGSPPEPTAIPPAAPSAEERIAADVLGETVRTEAGWPALTARLLGGNIVARIGAVVLFLGVGFLLKYAYDHAWLPAPLRLAGVAAGGIGLLEAGRRLLDRRRLYALILQGTGIGVLYLDVFFALKVYALIHPGPAFVLFMTLGIACTLLAVRQDAPVLAVIGLTGAFLAPPLASTGGGDPLLLFSYCAMLNLFVLAVSWFKAWRALNLTGFVFTFVLALAWGSEHYRPEHFAVVEPFLLLFFAVYLMIPVLFATRQPPRLRGLVDGTLVFGTPLGTAFLQAALVQDMPYGLAWSCVAGALAYAVIAALARRQAGMQLLAQTQIAIAVVLATLAVFFALDAYPTFALWTLEGAALTWVGLRQQRVLARAFGIGLQVVAALYFLAHRSPIEPGHPYFNDSVLGGSIVAIAALLTGALMNRHRNALLPREAALEPFLLAWASTWWFGTAGHALHADLAREQFAGAIALLASGSLLVADVVGRRLQWIGLRLLTLAHAPLLVVAALAILAGRTPHPLSGYGVFAWPIALGGYFWILRRQQRDGIDARHGTRYALGWLLLAALATWEGGWLLSERLYERAMLWSLAGTGAGYIRFRLHELGRPEAQKVSAAAVVWSLVLWFLGGLGAIDASLGAGERLPGMLALAAVTVWAFEWLGRRSGWTALRRAQPVLPVAIVATGLGQWLSGAHPLAGTGVIAWPLAALAQFVTLRRQDLDGEALATDAQLAGAIWSAVVVCAWELGWRATNAGLGGGWIAAVPGAIAGATILAIDRLGSAAFWPFAGRRSFHRRTVLTPLAVAGLVWSVLTNLSQPGSPAPYAYLPVANPFDAAHMLLLATTGWWLRAVPADGDPQEGAAGLRRAVGAAGFLWLNGVCLRSVHHWAGIPFEAAPLFASVAVQASLSLLWSVTALVLMLGANRARSRGPWLTGAALLAAVVAKLFLVDLANSGTIERIVSFLGVGGLLLAIGYLAPVPPGQTGESGVDERADAGSRTAP